MVLRNVTTYYVTVGVISSLLPYLILTSTKLRIRQIREACVYNVSERARTHAPTPRDNDIYVITLLRKTCPHCTVWHSTVPYKQTRFLFERPCRPRPRFRLRPSSSAWRLASAVTLPSGCRPTTQTRGLWSGCSEGPDSRRTGPAGLRARMPSGGGWEGEASGPRSPSGWPTSKSEQIYSLHA